MPAGDSIPPNTGGCMIQIMSIVIGILLAAVMSLAIAGKMPDLGPKSTPTPAVTTTVPATPTSTAVQ